MEQRRPDALDTGRAVEQILKRPADEHLHFLGSKPGRLGEERDSGSVEVGKNVNRQMQRLVAAKKGQQKSNDQDEEAIVQRELDDAI